ncbi:MAG: DUF302 domain-containing protein [Gammaproteobacteria bacterium]|nr:DUF302 domain-containing protein [Gammaproteobacteria bacterium]
MYEFNTTLDQPFDAALARVRQALADEQFGIVSEVDVQAVFRAKMEKEIPPYLILGACNPKLADRVLAAEPNAGTLLPCNLVVRASGEQTVVSFMDPVSVMGLSDSAEVGAVAAAARDKLMRVVAALEAS